MSLTRDRMLARLKAKHEKRKAEAAVANIASAAAAAQGRLSAPGQNAMIKLVKFQFIPNRVVVQKGASVTWTVLPASLFSGDDPPHRIVLIGNGYKSSPELRVGDSFTMTFNTVGEFEFYCSNYAFMSGIVQVVEKDPKDNMISSKLELAALIRELESEELNRKSLPAVEIEEENSPIYDDEEDSGSNPTTNKKKTVQKKKKKKKKSSTTDKNPSQSLKGNPAPIPSKRLDVGSVDDDDEVDSEEVDGGEGKSEASQEEEECKRSTSTSDSFDVPRKQDLIFESAADAVPDTTCNSSVKSGISESMSVDSEPFVIVLGSETLSESVEDTKATFLSSEDQNKESDDDGWIDITRKKSRRSKQISDQEEEGTSRERGEKKPLKAAEGKKNARKKKQKKEREMDPKTAPSETLETLAHGHAEESGGRRKPQKRQQQREKKPSRKGSSGKRQADIPVKVNQDENVKRPEENTVEALATSWGAEIGNSSNMESDEKQQEQSNYAEGADVVSGRESPCSFNRFEACEFLQQRWLEACQ